MLPHLLSSDALCGVRHLLLEWHPHVRGDAFAARIRALVNASLSGLGASSGASQLDARFGGDYAHEHQAHEQPAARASSCRLPQLSEVDDNSFMRDLVPFPNESVCAAAAPRRQQAAPRHKGGRRATRRPPVAVVLNLSVPTPGFCRFSEWGWEASPWNEPRTRASATGRVGALRCHHCPLLNPRPDANLMLCVLCMLAGRL